MPVGHRALPRLRGVVWRPGWWRSGYVVLQILGHVSNTPNGACAPSLNVASGLLRGVPVLPYYQLVQNQDFAVTIWKHPIPAPHGAPAARRVSTRDSGSGGAASGVSRSELTDHIQLTPNVRLSVSAAGVLPVWTVARERRAAPRASPNGNRRRPAARMPTPGTAATVTPCGPAAPRVRARVRRARTRYRSDEPGPSLRVTRPARAAGRPRPPRPGRRPTGWYARRAARAGPADRTAASAGAVRRRSGCRNPGGS